ncbi:hypothetical protein VP01_308g10 [Puccinia sorghi]|uniref:Uncharacterized protein n=1 Tax=Puccinia sorghi TaxID=27349 RepID=A0A0L6UZQ4_9BASI|nr:hypothetical protein VP01_308g10 [Puccinia sorghi]
MSYDLQLEDVKMLMVFRVMNDIKAKYFIICNNYLHAYKINMINDTVRYLTLGDIQEFKDQRRDEANIFAKLNSEKIIFLR